jgi:hypothetical protein
VTGQEVTWIFFSVKVIFVLGFRFCFELSSTFFVQVTVYIVTGC